VRVLSRLFRRLFLAALADAHTAGRLAFFGEIQDLPHRKAFDAHLAPLARKNWFVYTKPPFAGPQAVLAHLARYTHRVAISNSRLVSRDERGVTFRYKDYRYKDYRYKDYRYKDYRYKDYRYKDYRYKDYRRNGQARYRTMTLGADAFIRRFLLHILPKGFHRIGHDGLLASAGGKANIARARQLMAPPMAPVDPPAVLDTADPDATTDHRPPCPCCGGRIIIVEIFARGGAPRGPPSGAGIQT
jgi:Putative transposase